MRYLKNSLRGGFIQACEEYYLSLNGDISAICKISETPLVTYYSWYANDGEFRDIMRMFGDALKEKARASLHALINDEVSPWRCKIQAYQALYPEGGSGESEGDTGAFNLNISYNGDKV